MLLMCLSGCGTLSQSDEISIVLLHGWGTMEEDNQAMREIYSEFEKDNPDISLKLISMPSPENVTSKVKEMISVGNCQISFISAKQETIHYILLWLLRDM